MTTGGTFFDSLSVILIFAATVAFIIAFFEAGFRIGRYLQPRYAQGHDAPPGPMIGSTLAMLAFVLAITFSMTAARYDQRKQNLLAEVNAIESMYLRADLLAEPQKKAIQRFLIEYVDLRLSGARSGSTGYALTRSLELHDLLWKEVMIAVNDNPTRLSAMLVQSANDVIAIHEKRVTSAVRQRIPPEIWFALYAIAGFAMISVGSQAGLSGSRRVIQVIPTALGFAMLMTLIVDLDRPADIGLVKVNQAAMMDLSNRLEPGGQ